MMLCSALWTAGSQPSLTQAVALASWASAQMSSEQSRRCWFCHLSFCKCWSAACCCGSVTAVVPDLMVAVLTVPAQHIIHAWTICSACTKLLTSTSLGCSPRLGVAAGSSLPYMHVQALVQVGRLRLAAGQRSEELQAHTFQPRGTGLSQTCWAAPEQLAEACLPALQGACAQTSNLHPMSSLAHRRPAAHRTR